MASDDGFGVLFWQLIQLFELMGMKYAGKGRLCGEVWQDNAL